MTSDEKARLTRHPSDSSNFSKASTRFSKTSAFSKILSPGLPIVEPKPVYATSSPVKPSKWSLFARMPSFGQAFAGVSPPPPVRTVRRDVVSKIMITVPSPTIGGLDDELILQMVGAAPSNWKGRKGTKQVFELQDLACASEMA